MFVIAAILFYSISGWSYPDFISYGYNRCMTCHYNAHGNGPLTDYGKALFSQEIAARNFWTSKKIDDETVAENSTRFIPGVDLPYWIRPSVKVRSLWLQHRPRSSNEVQRTIRMQRDFNLVFSADDSYKSVLILNYGLLHESYDYYGKGKETKAVSREHYLRFFPTKKLLVAAGLMDIVYGLRTGDHTSVSRGRLGLGQDDQVHGLLAQWSEDSWDVTGHVFVGNSLRTEGARKEGASVQAEFVTSETNKIGFSALQYSNDLEKALRLGIHNRYGFENAPGSSLLAELGVWSDEDLGVPKTEGMYFMVQSLVKLTRGYNLISTAERYQDKFRASSTEISRWTLGFLTFPFQHTELRITAVQAKGYDPEAATEDTTQLQGQLHVSW